MKTNNLEKDDGSDLINKHANDAGLCPGGGAAVLVPAARSRSAGERSIQVRNAEGCK